MNQYEREFFVSRICAGYLKYENDDLSLKIVSPDKSIMYEAQHVFMETISRAKKFDCLSEEEVLDILYSKNLWTKEDENELEDVLPKHLDWWKKELYDKFENSAERDKIKKFIVRVKESIESLFATKHAFDHLTSNGVATYARWQYIVEKCTQYDDGRKFDWANASITHIMDYVSKNQINDSILREIARTEPWRSIWVSGKKSGNIFGIPSCELNVEQRRLITWSSLYDNILDSPDCPSAAVIEDDDALDGWMLLQQKKQEEKKKGEARDRKSRIPDAAEVYFVASDTDQNALYSKKDIHKIYEMNDPSSRAIIRQRQAIIQSRGEVSDKDFIDVQRDVSMAATRAMQGAMRS